MKISKKNYEKIVKLYHFCQLYIAHRDFDLAKKIAKSSPLTWKQAEGLSDFCNQIIRTKQSKPQEFISEENESNNKAIEKYLILKDCLKQIKFITDTKSKNELYKSVKLFYRRKTYCYQMDSYYTFLITGLFMYANKMITFSEFKDNYCFEVSLFTGKKSPINIKYVIKMSNYILNF